MLISSSDTPVTALSRSEDHRLEDHPGDEDRPEFVARLDGKLPPQASRNDRGREIGQGLRAMMAIPIPAFTPVPGRARRDGWTRERQRCFIAALAHTGCVDRAARTAGMSREGAYRLRRREGAESFAAVWDSILAARPRGTTHPALVWHRLVQRYGGRGAVVREPMTPAERERLKLAALRLAESDLGGRSQ